METKLDGWAILGIDGVPTTAHTYDLAPRYESKEAARFAAYGVVTRRYTRYTWKDAEGHMVHRVTVGLCSVDGDVVVKDSNFLAHAVADNAGNLKFYQEIEKA